MPTNFPANFPCMNLVQWGYIHPPLSSSNNFAHKKRCNFGIESFQQRGKLVQFDLFIKWEKRLSSYFREIMMYEAPL